MIKNKTSLIIGVLVGIIVVLSLLLVYVFVISPTITGYVVQGQNEAVSYTVLSIMQMAAKCQTVPLTFGNQTINLVAVECLQQGQQQTQAQQG